jgi:hypothetical protein
MALTLQSPGPAEFLLMFKMELLTLALELQQQLSA